MIPKNPQLWNVSVHLQHVLPAKLSEWHFTWFRNEAHLKVKGQAIMEKKEIATDGRF